MVKITLEFKSVDEAIVALGKLVGIKTSAAPQEKVNAAQSSVVPAAAVESGKRKPRADKGQKREPYKPREQEAAAPEKDGTVQSDRGTGKTGSALTLTPAAGAPDVASPPAALGAKTPHEIDVQAAVEKLYGEKGYDTTLAALSRYGVKRGKDLLPEHRANFIADVARILAGGAV